MTTVTLYTKPGCCLCDDAKQALARVRAVRPYRLEEVDLTSHPALLERYGERLPVVLVNGAEAFEFEVDETELARLLGAAQTAA